MTFRNSMKQLLRTPIRTLVMFCLISVATALFLLGILIFWWNQKDIAEFEGSFTTLGTVEQKADEVVEQTYWDAETEEKSYYSKKIFHEWISDDVLKMEGIDYLIQPEKRPYFVAVIPGLAEKVWELYSAHTEFHLIEVIPEQTQPLHAMKVHVESVISGNAEFEGTDIYICEHHDENPPTLEAGKKYIMFIQGPAAGHDQDVQMAESAEGLEEYPNEYYLLNLHSTQYTLDGEAIGQEAGAYLFDEVTDGFYDTVRGKAWLAFAEGNSTENTWSELPVRPVESTDMLMAFHSKNASVVEGCDISEEAYAKGEDVCMISRKYAELMGLTVGDEIPLPLIYVVYKTTPGQNYTESGGSAPGSPLNAEFEPYQVFDNDNYKIVGIYEMEAKDDSSFDLAPYEVIVPYKSVTGDWSKNIVSDGPMTAGTTEFQIKNGKADEFRNEWEKQGIDNLKITFYDGGYEAFQNTIHDRKMMSYILMLGGGIATIVILALFGHLQIIKQRNRIFIERALGMTKRACRRSVLSGMYLILMLGVCTGGMIGFFMTDSVMDKLKPVTLYDTTFSSGVAEMITFTNQMSLQQKGLCIAAGCMVILVAAGIIYHLYISHILKGELVELMEKEE